MDSLKVFLSFGNLEQAKMLLRYNRKMSRYLLAGYARSLKTPRHRDPKLYHASYAWTYIFLLGALCSASDVATEELVDKGLIETLAISSRGDIKDDLWENYFAVNALWNILMSGNIKHKEKMKKSRSYSWYVYKIIINSNFLFDLCIRSLNFITSKNNWEG